MEWNQSNIHLEAWLRSDESYSHHLPSNIMGGSLVAKTILFISLTLAKMYPKEWKQVNRSLTTNGKTVAPCEALFQEFIKNRRDSFMDFENTPFSISTPN